MAEGSGEFPEKRDELHRDWRLPTQFELLTLVEFREGEVVQKVDDTTPEVYLTNDTPESLDDKMFAVDFRIGHAVVVRDKSFGFVRAVRDGKNGLEWARSSYNTMSIECAIEYADNLLAPTYFRGVDNVPS